MKQRKDKTKTDPRGMFMPITMTVEVPREGWEELVTLPEHVSEHNLESMNILADMFVRHSAPVEVFLSCKALFDLHLQMFIQRDQKMGRYGARGYWPAVPSSDRRKIYRDVGIALGYDF